MGRLLQAALMAPGPFYFYPWKPFINQAAGDTYATAFKHFKTGHRHDVNVALHFVCLCLQLAGNFALLTQLDGRLSDMGWTSQLPSVRVLTATTAVLWASYLWLATSGTPNKVAISILSTVACAAAYYVAPLVTIELLDIFSLVAMVGVAIAVNLSVPAKLRIQWLGVAKLLGVLLSWTLGWMYVTHASWSWVGAYNRLECEIGAAVFAYTFVVSLFKNPLKPLVISGMLLTRAAGLATGNVELQLWGYAFFASFLQGMTHLVCREEGTLLSLERGDDEDAKTRYEYAHVTFFPSLLFDIFIRGNRKGF